MKICYRPPSKPPKSIRSKGLEWTVTYFNATVQPSISQKE